VPAFHAYFTAKASNRFAMPIPRSVSGNSVWVMIMWLPDLRYSPYASDPDLTRFAEELRVTIEVDHLMKG
jgi:hypothetical protein